MAESIKGLLIFLTVLTLFIAIIRNTMSGKEVRHNFFLNIWVIIVLAIIVFMIFKGCQNF